MDTTKIKSKNVSPSRVSWDTWAVVAAFLAALLIRIGAVKHIPW